MGIISSIGNTFEENRAALLASKAGIGPITQLATKHAASIQVGEVSLTNTQLAEGLQLDSNNNFTRTALLGTWAAREAVKNASCDLEDGLRTGFLSATTVGGMDMTEKYLKEFETHPQIRKYISSHHAGDSSEKIASYLGINGLVTTISTACSSAANAIMTGARLINSGKLDRVLVGGTDALSLFTINGFKSLMILSENSCTPFDEHRSGLNLGEGAAFLMLESPAALQKRHSKVLAYLSGYANANDAFHQTASSDNGEGAFLAMKNAMAAANIAPDTIDYINAHGTATLNNDLSESHAMIRLFGKNIPAFSSTKGYTGHTLAAAGAIEAVFSVVALQKQVIFPNLNFSIPIAETGLAPQTALQKKKLRYVISNSFGFGGNCSSLVFSKA